MIESTNVVVHKHSDYIFVSYSNTSTAKDQNTIQDKIEKKPSTAARVARGLGLKRHDKETKTPPPPLVTNGASIPTEKVKPPTLQQQKTSTSTVIIPNSVQAPPPTVPLAAPPQSPTSIQAPSGISSYRLDR